MKKEWNRSVFMILMVLATLLLGSLTVNADEIDYGDITDPVYSKDEVTGNLYGCVFEPKKKRVEIIDIVTTQETLEIPAYLNYHGVDYAVWNISEWWYEGEYKGIQSKDVIKRLIIPNTTSFVSIEAHRWKRLQTIVVSESVKRISTGTTNVKIKINKNNKWLKNVGPAVYTKDGDWLIALTGKKKVYKIAKGTKYLSSGVFVKNQYIEKVIMPDSILKMDPYDGAFRNCRNLKKVVLSENIKKIRSETFKNCRKLSEIYINNRKKAPKIDSWAFHGTKKGIKFYVKNEKVAKQLKEQLKHTKAKQYKVIVKK